MSFFSPTIEILSKGDARFTLNRSANTQRRRPAIREERDSRRYAQLTVGVILQKALTC